MTSGKPSPLVLLANAHAEETKLISTTLRGFFPDCRLEAVYTSEEALQWSLRDDWNLILVDDALSPRTGAEILHELKRNSPRAAIILQTDRHDSAAALQALQQGADFLLFKESPGYVTELLFYTQEALEKRELESKLDQTFQRHLRLLESVSDLVYELDHEGRFVYVSPTVTSLLGYAPEELAGRHFSFLLPPAQERIAQYHMNERRAGARSAHQLELYVLRKSSEKKKDRMALMQLTAKGLYDERHRYLGTVGLLRDLSSHQEQVGKVQTLEAKLQEVDRQLAASRNAVLSSQHLHQPLSALLEDSQRLLATLQSIQFDQHVKQLATYAARATEMGYEVWRAVQFSGRHTEAIAINDILRHVIGGLAQDQLLDAETVEERFSPTLPHIIGHAEDIKQLFRILILYALQAPAGTPTGARLLLETYVLKSAGSAAIASPAMISPPLTPYIVTIIRQETVGPATTIRLPIPSISGAEFLLAHDIVHRHSGSIEIDSPTSRLCRIAVRLPATLPRPVSGISESSAEKTQGTQPLSSTSSVTPALRSDRRRFERIRLRVPLHVSIGTTVWQGTMLDIGLGGILVAFTQPIPPVDHHPVYLIIRTSISFLELQGTVRYRSRDAGETPRTSFIIEFAHLTQAESAVLTSLIQSLREPFTGVTIEAQIPDTTERARDETPPSSSQRERRWSFRIKVARPIHLVFQSGDGPQTLSGFAINLSQGGACIQISGLSEGEAAQLSAPSEEARHVLLTDNSIPHELPAVIAWTGRQGSSETWHVGVSLHRLSPAAEVSLNEVLASRLISPPQVGQGVDGDKLRTALTFLQAPHGGSFALSHDRFTDHLREDSPILIIAPGYAQTRVDYLGLASAFGTNGFRILRFDSTHGLGLGNGNPRSATLGALKDDLDTVVDFAQEHWPGAPLAVLASDLSARVVLKLFGQQRTADLLLLIDPVLDLQAALRAFHHRDIVEARTTGSEFGLIDLLGLPLDADAFLDDAGVGRYADFASVVDDIGRLRCRVALITTPPAQRTYGFAKVVDHSLIQRVTDMLSGRVTSLSLASPVTGQELSSEMQREACFSLVMQCKALLSLHQGAFDLAHEPDSVGISTQFRQEIEQLRIKHHMTRPARAQLWTQYSQHSGVLNEIPSYVQHSNDLYQTVHLFRSHRDILDVGCSHYGFARLWWVNRTYAAPSHPFVDTSDQRYVGIDVHWDSVRSAHEAFTALRRQRSTFSPGIPSTAPPVPFQWIVGDASCLPLGSNLFDHVVCHFTLNFSSNPAVTLRELYRLLRPNGTLTVSSFTPSTDLAAVYRGHLHETRQDGLSGVHRDVLRDLAHLNESIRCRRLHSFTKQSLAALFEHVTTGPVRTFPSLAGHVLITTVQKPDSAR